MRMTTDQILVLEKEAEFNDGHCGTCMQTIKFYRYKINKSHVTFMRAMADAVHNTGANNVDIATIGVPYSVRSQVTKLRQHGLIARVKNDKGAQIPRRWLIATKGWAFLNGKTIPSKVVVFNNQVLGHDGDPVNVYDVMGERVNVGTVKYEEAAVSTTESRTYDNVRTPRKLMTLDALYVGMHTKGGYVKGQKYNLTLDRLQVGKPVKILAPHDREYRDIAAFQKEWRAI